MKITFIKHRLFFIYSIFLLFHSCSGDANEVSIEPEILNQTTRGSGFFEYRGSATFSNKVIKTYFHIPTNVNPNSKILFVFHGNGRNAKDYRNAMIEKGNQYNFITIAPEFSEKNFLGGDGYNLGNVFVDGDNPSPSTLNPEEEWTFSVIAPLFDYVRQNLKNNNDSYDIFGHSAGGQVAHRFVFFKPNARYNKVVASASGWYTTTDIAILFPYGFKESPLVSMSLNDLFQKKLILQVGNLDNNPNAASLRHNIFADAQGLNRLDRAQNFFNKASLLADNNNLAFEWELYIHQNADHNYKIASQNAADLLFN